MVVTELAAQLKSRTMRLEAEWAPRELNVEADRLSNLDFSGFDPALRVRVPLEQAEWLVLPELMAAGRGFLEARGAAGEPSRKATAGGRRRPKELRLRATDPW